jgi:hypothetical protein
LASLHLPTNVRRFSSKEKRSRSFELVTSPTTPRRKATTREREKKRKKRRRRERTRGRSQRGKPRL